MAITKLRKCRNLYHELDILEERLMFGCSTVRPSTTIAVTTLSMTTCAIAAL